MRLLSFSRSMSCQAKVKQYGIKGITSGVACDIYTSSGFQMRTDIPKVVGGDNSAPEPIYHVLSALVGCESATAMFVARKLRLDVTSIRFEVRASRDERGALALPIDRTPVVPSRLDKIEGTAFVSSPKSISDLQLHTLAEQTHARCPVANMISSSGTELSIKFVLETEH